MLQGFVGYTVHRNWLGELYAWAGQYRTVELQKDNFAWPPAWRVSDNLAVFEREMLGRFTPCRPGPLAQVADAMAHIHAELLLIHPFRDGNGRLARWLADIMAVQAGYPVPDYGLTGRGSGTTPPLHCGGLAGLRSDLRAAGGLL